MRVNQVIYLKVLYLRKIQEKIEFFYGDCKFSKCFTIEQYKRNRGFYRDYKLSSQKISYPDFAERQ